MELEISHRFRAAARAAAVIRSGDAESTTTAVAYASASKHGPRDATGVWVGTLPATAARSASSTLPATVARSASSRSTSTQCRIFRHF